MTDEASWGPIEAKVRADIDALVTGHPMGEALAGMACDLARRLDLDADGVRVAALFTELRATLLELAGMGAGGDDDLDDVLSRPTGGDGMPTPVRDDEEPS